MKTCPKCKKTKQDSDFWINKKRKDGLQTSCKDCKREWSKKHYLSNSQGYKDRAIERNKKTRDALRKEVSEIKSQSGCKFCQERTSVCLDFHHFDDKDMEVSQIVSSGLRKKALDEIKKCIVVCANCHRKLHAGLIS